MQFINCELHTTWSSGGDMRVETNLSKSQMSVCVNIIQTKTSQFGTLSNNDLLKSGQSTVHTVRTVHVLRAFI